MTATETHTPAESLQLVPLTRDEANRFIRAHHRHCGRVQAHRGAIGAELNGELVGVAVIGNPPARLLATSDRFLVEITRLCTSPDAPRNTASWLYARARRAASALGFRRVTTVNLDAESGASLRGAGFRIVGTVRRGRGWNRRQRPRGELATDGIGKSRWEANA